MFGTYFIQLPDCEVHSITRETLLVYLPYVVVSPMGHYLRLFVCLAGICAATVGIRTFYDIWMLSCGRITSGYDMGHA